ncbi:MAG TPA: TetR/AcrR family transcriptional regulator, partial [Microvirga sp.]|nr:TetR/AcrR family transcriptional regulator [Microvirga sp.]
MSKLTRTSKAAGGQRRDVLRRAILEAASRLFVERGFGGTNLQDIADALGISRPAVYYYYKSKEDILDSLVKEVTVVSGQQAMTLAGTNDFDPIETLRRMVYSHAKWLLEHPLEFR